MDEGSIIKIGEISVWVAVAVGLLAVVGLLWAPIGAFSCVLVARARNLAPGGYGTSGAKCSMLLILPWIYLVIRLFDRSVPVFFVILVYILVYAVWAVGIIGGQVISIVSFVVNAYGDEPLPLAVTIVWIGLTLVAVSISALTMVRSAKKQVQDPLRIGRNRVRHMPA